MAIYREELHRDAGRLLFYNRPAVTGLAIGLDNRHRERGRYATDEWFQLFTIRVLPVGERVGRDCGPGGTRYVSPPSRSREKWLYQRPNLDASG